MKRNSLTVICIILCAGMLAGCGGEYAGLTERDVVSGSVVSGSAVSGEAVSGDAIRENTVKQSAGKEAKQDMSSHHFCTDTNLYYLDYGKDYNSPPRLMQARTDGTHKKCIKDWKKYSDDEIQLLYVDENWLYYDIEELLVGQEDDEEITYRVPIEKDAQGYDVVQLQKAEEVVKTEITIPIYADSDYYFYIDLDTDKLIKYDLRKNKKDSETTEHGIGGKIYRGKDFYFHAHDNGTIYVQKIDSGKWKKVSTYMNDDEYLVAQGEEAFFYPSYVTEEEDRVDIHRFDGEKEEKFITWEQLNHAVKEAAGAEKLDLCYVSRLFAQNGRLYIQTQTGWMDGKTYQMGYMIFSMGESEDTSGLCYEKGMTECMKSHVKERNGKWCDDEDVYVEHMVLNDAKCIAMVDGKAYLSLFDHEKDKGRMGCYDLDTGAFEWVSEKDEAYYKLGYDDELDTFESVFSGHVFNEFVEVEMSPLNDKYDNGEFVEN
ncbi:MAG: DUF5050 domain-containing protein [Roseburia sp.]|nr:DUF5050 domain-containing protein [Roseburia sp.]